jgi:hypothetical protein
VEIYEGNQPIYSFIFGIEWKVKTQYLRHILTKYARL